MRAAVLVRLDQHVVSNIRVPTLVLHRAEDQRVKVAAGRFLGRSIPGACYVELPGVDHVAWAGDAERLARRSKSS